MESDTILLPGMAEFEPSEKSPLSPAQTQTQPMPRAMQTLEGIKMQDGVRV